MSRILRVLCLLCAVAGTSRATEKPHADGPHEQVRTIQQRVAEQLAGAESAHAPVAPPAAARATRAAAATAAAPAAMPVPGHGAGPEAAVGPADPEAIWHRLMTGNRRFVDVKPLVRPYVAQRADLAGGQRPQVIVLACADSRVSPELVLDQSLGDLFVVRTAGNIADVVALGSIEYALEHLHVPLLVVMGHEKCGAVAAALESGDMPTANLQAIVDRIRPATLKPRTCFEGAELVSRCVASNVSQSARDIEANSPVVRAHTAARTLVIKRAVYDLKSGMVTALE